MALHPIFKLREETTKELLSLLDTTVLGTNGAHYRHLDTEEKISECDQLLHLSMERNEKVLGNISFCRRSGDWYVRYFAFSTLFQSTGKKKPKNGNSLLKRELNSFFNGAFQGAYGEPVNSFYAYIDPNNEKSLWMSETFGFEKIAEVATQTYGRSNPKNTGRIEKLDNWNELEPLVSQQFSDYQFFFTAQTSKPPYYVIRDEHGDIIAAARTTKAHWEIKRLPGKLGGFLVKLIPIVPVLNKLVRPKNHHFLVPEAVIIRDNDPKLLEELFSGILHEENKNLMIWWVDVKDELYRDVKSVARWGLLHKLVGVNQANVVCKRNPKSTGPTSKSPVYTVGLDFI